MFKKGLLIGLINLIIGMILSFIYQGIFPSIASEYQNVNVFRPWTDPLMTVWFAYPFVLSIALAYFWNIIGKKFTGSNNSKAFQFAKLYFIIATIPGMFASYTCIQISFLMTLTWLIDGFLQAYIAGLLLAKWNK
jgi:hypothetical protein